MKDLKNQLNIIRAISPVAIGTTGTGKTSPAIGLAGYEGAVIEASYGAITATGAVFTAVVTECATSGGTFTSVADADLIGTESDLGVAAGARASGSSMNVTKRIGYVGAQPFIKVQLSSTVTAGTPIGVNVIRGAARRNPVTA